MTGKSPQFRIGNGYDNDDLEEDWFWDMQLQQDIWRNVWYNETNTPVIQIHKNVDVPRSRFTESIQ